MGKIDLSPLLHNILVFVRKFASKITVTNTSICSRSIFVEMPKFCDCSFTVRVKDFIAMLKQTQEFTVEEKELRYSYEASMEGSLVNVERRIKRYEEEYQIAGGVPLLSIAINGLKVLSSEEIEIKAGKDGNFVMESFGVVRTRSKYSGLRVPESTVDSVTVKVRGRDLRILEELKGDVIFSFLDSHILAYSLGDNFTIVIQISILNT
ncbi:uncharacterized protein Eint_080040 [Encephalitozoon intestinalis ATCC 50506]|uniref:Uncharacterized protein n=1 Tax=Encephalitozoon intestinalis (strain ATCC 50506) TaxID=876142 RepID=E0S8E7_ENCIT|nr:uncharacterized protein Eint_080040 [Encephalitozoon intestinalis ATCC 50506]ADM11941.1 hypothetical protein Eint_080040 [Encephalitozoon intestinalis ATCC 50506]UTX45723.1 DNA polymerase sliding clamp 2 [Encephalitozoon intestinalis]